MGQKTRLIILDHEDQAKQADQLVRTDNGTTVEEEEVMLEAMFGPADTNGVYGAHVCGEEDCCPWLA